MKLTTLFTAALLITPIFVAPALAQQRLCIVDNSNQVVCGRPATQDEIWRSNTSQQGNSTKNYYSEINKIYREVLGRDGDFRGIQGHVRAIQDGESLRDIRRSIVQSQEARDKINQIYREVLGRDADSNGMQSQLRALQEGRSLNDIRRTIERSPEARTRSGK